MKDERFPRTARIGSGREIRELLRRGRRCRLGPVDLFVGPAEDRPRVGVIVPRYGHSAVERNRLRRRVKEIARREWLSAAREREGEQRGVAPQEGRRFRRPEPAEAGVVPPF